ncbi:tyrosine-type recombinase/integrase [Arthrobacter sp. CAN_C5]|uniref:tyrosine-type recombinase/integrase n=1 Tax=Arthrobacter sp. CAN_C5 TaxID=2760706 RepID=UPI001AE31317|nr:integrase [Arthrobacter sp. CAN_C5]
MLPWLLEHSDGRPESAPLFESPRKSGHPVGKRYVSDVLTLDVIRANDGRSERIARMNVHGLRHTFAAIALSEAGADILSVSRALGHSMPSTTLNEHGHLAPAGLEPLMARIDELVGAQAKLA